MKTLDFTIDQDDLKALFICTRDSHKRGVTFQNWKNNCEANYEQYFERQLQLDQTPKTFSQWINGQVVSLT